MEKITNSCEFKILHDNYTKLVTFLRSENERFINIRETASSLLTDSLGNVIFNSKLFDDLSNTNIVGSNSFNNYLTGSISFVNIHQSKASTIADKKGTSTVYFMLPLNNDRETYAALYVSKHVGVERKPKIKLHEYS